MKNYLLALIAAIFPKFGVDAHSEGTVAQDLHQSGAPEWTVGEFVASVLLSDKQWDKDKFIEDCKNDWDLDLGTADNGTENIIVEMNDTVTVAISFMPVCVPNKEAEFYASANYMWKDAVKVAKKHKAHILVSVIGKNGNPVEVCKLFTKIVASCLKQKNATAVYTDGAVFHPGFYIDIASFMREGELPILDWVWFGIDPSKEYAGVYTYGMRKFGKEEMEVYTNMADVRDVRDFLINIAIYVLESDATLKDGETIGITEDQRLRITLSDGIAVDGKTLKIDFP